MPKEVEEQNHGEVTVTVYYNAAEKAKSFRRNQTVEEILLWAVVEFEIDPSMATEFELALHGVTGELPTDMRIGTLAHGDQTIALDLVRGEISNGAMS
jgi:hypothetical protein